MADGEMTGLAQLRALMMRGEGAPIAQTLGFTLTEAEEGRVIFEGAPGRAVYNPIGTVHGGYAATLLDSACGCAVHTRLQPGQRYTTLELKVSYQRALHDGVKVRAEGRVISMGRRAAFAEATLVDEAGRLCATATSTLLVMSD